jgi:outer membrane receptor protein involved in Fe transport
MLARGMAGLAMLGMGLPPVSVMAADDNVVEEIVVTGSRLVRRDFSAPSPIASIDRETLLSTGQATLESALNQMPQVTPQFDRTANNPGNGTATINLRGLGSNRTLVTINGRRVSPSWVGSTVDINGIPQSLVDRVEIITGGATTVYGADAVAGVVNFILRDDFDGFGLDTSLYATEHGDANTRDINLSYGYNFAGGRGNVTAYAGYYDRDALFASERELTATSLRETWSGELLPGGSSVIPEGIIFTPRIDFGNGPVRTMFDANGDPVPYDEDYDRYDFAPVNYLQLPLERTTAGTLFRYDFSDRAELYGEWMYSRNDVTQTLAPVPAGGFFVINADNPTLTAATRQLIIDNFFPAGPGVYAGAYGRRMTDVGLRIIETETENLRMVTGLRGAINDNWDYDAWVIYNDVTRDEYQLNDVSASRMQQGQLVDPVTGQCFDPSNGCVPVNLFGINSLTAEAVEFLRLRPIFNTSTRRQTSASGFVRGEPFDSWAGAIQVAIGAEWRRDEGSFEADDILFSGDTLGYRADASINGSEDVAELYVEASIPLADGARFAEYLALEVGARYSEYDFAGSVESWKAGLEWLPVGGLRFRTMLQRSVRAPNMAEAFQDQFQEPLPTYVGNDPREDPCSAVNDPVGAGNAEKCVMTGLPADQVGVWNSDVGFPAISYNGGNADLKPEVADTFTIGAVIDLELFEGFQLAVDYFDLYVEDTIGNLDETAACFDPANTTGQFCTSLRRDPATFNVTEVDRFKTNRGVAETRGIDTQLSTQFVLPNSADLAVSLIWTHLFENSIQELPFGTSYDCAGYYGWPCTNFKDDYGTFPENRVTTNFVYAMGDLTLGLNWRWIEGTIPSTPIGAELFFGIPDPDLVITEIGSKNYLDLSIGYRFTDNIDARFSIANLTDTNAPLMADAGLGPNTDAAMYDVFGRSYTLSLSLRY